MIDKVTAIILARGGSKRLHRKNVKSCAGKPLIAWTIDAALASERIDGVYVSTEDKEIADISRKRGAYVLQRPFDLAEDDTKSELVVAWHLLESATWHKWVMLLQPTSPCRKAYHIDDFISKFDEKYCKSGFSVIAGREKDNGAMYLFNAAEFFKQRSFFMEPICRYPMMLESSVDINTRRDFELAETELQNKE
jgi:CMP-N-acetylneuraminic acid synthetase